MVTHFFASLPVLLFFLLGFFLRRIRFFDRRTIEDSKKLIMHLSVPALLFRAFLSLSIEPSYLILLPIIYLMAASMVLLGKTIARITGISSPYFPLLLSGFEMGMFGYALFISLYGVEHLGKLAFLGFGQTLFTFTFLISMLMTLRVGKQSVRIMFRRLYTSPIILAMILGAIVGRIAPPFDSHPILATLDSLLQLVGGITVPLITITIGYDIAIERKGLGLSLFTVFVRKSLLVVFALLINRFIINDLLHMDDMYRYAMMVLALTPASFIHSILVRENDPENIGYVNRTLSLDCLISVFLTMIMAAIY